MRLEKILWVGVEWINLAQDTGKWRAVVGTVMNFSVFLYYLRHPWPYQKESVVLRQLMYGRSLARVAGSYPAGGIDVCRLFVFFVLGRGPCDELFTRPEQSYRLWCVVLCDLKTSWMKRPWPTLDRSATGPKTFYWLCCRLEGLKNLRNAWISLNGLSYCVEIFILFNGGREENRPLINEHTVTFVS